MDELLPICIGLAAGLLATWIGQARPAIIGFAVALGGPLSTWFSGEAEMTWGFVVVDMGEVLLAATLPVMFLAYRRSRLASHRYREGKSVSISEAE